MTRQARISWTLPPEDQAGGDPAAPGQAPSLWASQKIVLRALIQAVLGQQDLNSLLARARDIHRSLAEAPRRRRRAFSYPFGKIS